MSGLDDFKEYLMNKEFTLAQWEMAKVIIREVAAMVLAEPEKEGGAV